MTSGTLHIELTFVYHPISTNCHALHCVSSLTYYFLLLRVLVFINTVFRELHFNCSSFTAFVCLWMVGCEASYLWLWIHTLDSFEHYSIFGQHIIYIYIILAEGWDHMKFMYVLWIGNWMICLVQDIWFVSSAHTSSPQNMASGGHSVFWDVMLSLGDWLWHFKGSLPSSARSKCWGHLEL
jgi:hypothetical protein